MPIRIITVPFNPKTGLFEDEDLRRFVTNKTVQTLKSKFFQINGRAYWTVFLEYEVVLSEENGKVREDGLNESQRLLFARLREWRKERAQKEGIPVFIIATNKELLEVVRQTPGTKEALRQIHGFGRKKIDKYGDAVLRIVTAFYRKSPGNAR